MDYYKHPAMSRSTLVDLGRMTPYKFYCKHVGKTLEKASTKALEFGSAFHCQVLEPHLFMEQYCIEPKFDKRTKKGKEDFSLFAENCKDKNIITSADGQMLAEMVYSLRRSKLNKILDICENKEEEFYFKLHDLDFRAKLDAVSISKNIIVDLKSCREAFIGGTQFASEMIKNGNAEQVYIYSEAYRSKYGKQPKFYFLCVEKQSPFEVQLFDASELYEYGKIQTINLLDKYKSLIEKYGDNDWVDTSINKAELPKWANQIVFESLNK